MKSSFFDTLPGFSVFSEVTDSRHFFSVPEDWHVIVADIRGSTQAINEGRYRDVNLVGAATIAALTNALPETSIPFVFGGDGATFLVPENTLEKVSDALKQTQALAQRDFGLTLRVGIVAVRDLRKHGADVQIGKYLLTARNPLAQFRGSGLTVAENWIKSAQPPAQLLISETQTPAPDLTGLSCRWEPFIARQGLILSLLIQARGSQPDEIYRQAISQLESILVRPLKEAGPISAQGMSVKWPPTTLRLEAQALKRKWPYFFVYALLLLHSLLARFAFFINLKLPGLSIPEYKRASVLNSDFKKFDDMLRMVIDCTEQQAALITEYLESEYQKGHLYYGLHKGASAIMTCFLYGGLNDRHVHFVDGDGGGYALAAVQLKAQKSASKD